MDVIIPAAGWGTRSLPASKVIPKEMSPVFDRPIIQWVMEEAAASGVKRVAVITQRGKESLIDHFDSAPELEAALIESGKKTLIPLVRTLPQGMELVSVRQGAALGLGHAVLCGRSMVGGSHFGVMLGDDMVAAKVPGMLQLINFHKSKKLGTEDGVVMLMEVEASETSKYGICELNKKGLVTRAVEKPKSGVTESRLAIVARYLLPVTIFGVLQRVAKEGGEIQLTSALQVLAEKGNLYGCVLDGKRFDAGDRLGLLKANLHYYLNSSFRAEVLKMISEVK